MKKLSIFLNGLFKENPTFVMLIGMCPTIAITTSFSDAIGMGACVIFVLFFSNLLISLIRKIVPNEIRIPVFIVVIAALVTIVELVLQAWQYPLYKSLGAFVSLIVVNCIILGRAEAFASKNNPVDSMLDGLGMGIGFTLAILLITAVRIGLSKLGLFFDMCAGVPKENRSAIELFTSPVGGFLVLGLLIGIIQAIRLSIEKKNKTTKEVAK